MGRRKITRSDWENLPSHAVIHADPEKDRIFLNSFVYQRQSGKAVEKALELLGGETDRWFLEDPEYWTAYGKTEEEEDIGYLREQAMNGSGAEARFAFCRLTGYHYPVPECDAYSHRTFDVGRAGGMTDDLIREFCREMVGMNGPFAKEAEECLKEL